MVVLMNKMLLFHAFSFSSHSNLANLFPYELCGPNPCPQEGSDVTTSRICTAACLRRLAMSFPPMVKCRDQVGLMGWHVYVWRFVYIVFMCDLINVYQVVPGTCRGGSFEKETWLIGIRGQLERSELKWNEMKCMKWMNWHEGIETHGLPRMNCREWLEIKELKWRHWSDLIETYELTWMNWNERIKRNELKWKSWNEGSEVEELKWRNWNDGIEVNELERIIKINDLKIWNERIDMNDVRCRNWNEGIDMKELTWINWKGWIDMN